MDRPTEGGSGVSALASSDDGSIKVGDTGMVAASVDLCLRCGVLLGFGEAAVASTSTSASAGIERRPADVVCVS